MASGSVLERLRRRAGAAAGLRSFRFFNREIDAPRNQPQGPLELCFATELQVLDLCEQSDLDLRSNAVTRAFERGDLCVVAFDGGRLAGYCWVAFSPVPHLDDVWVRFGPDVAWTYKSLVRPAYRGKGLAGQLYRFGDAACLERARRCSVICVESHNTPSVTAAQKAGYADAGSAGYIRRGPVFLDWYSTPIRRDGVNFFVPARP